MSYVDGFVAPVATADKETYRAHAAEMAEIFKGEGALAVTECWGDQVPEGEVTSFPLAVKLQPEETVVFSWIVWPSRDARDPAWERLSDHPKMVPSEMPFDGKRMIYGGFEAILEA